MQSSQLGNYNTVGQPRYGQPPPGAYPNQGIGQLDSYGYPEARSSQGQPLLGPGERIQPGDRGKSDHLGQSDMSFTDIACVGFGAWVVFSVISLTFGLTYHSSYVQIWAVVFLGTIVLCAIIWQSWRFRFEMPSSRAHLIIGVWLLVSVVWGVVVGLSAYDCCISEYWHAQELEARENVLPSEAAAAYANAGEIVFADEARVDAGKAVGYKDTTTYCVAPIASDAPFEQVQFWAAGTDCCGARGTFTCDDAWNPKARAGLVIHDVSTMNEGLIPKYKDAVKLAEATYSIASTKDPIFVRWVADPDQVELNIWATGMGVLLSCIFISALCCGLQVCAVHSALWNMRGMSWA